MRLVRKNYSLKSALNNSYSTVKDGFTSKSKLRDKFIEGESDFIDELEAIHREARKEGGIYGDLKDRYESLKESRQKDKQDLEDKLKDIHKSRVKLAKVGALLTAGGLLYKGASKLGSKIFKKKEKK